MHKRRAKVSEFASKMDFAKYIFNQRDSVTDAELMKRWISNWAFNLFLLCLIYQDKTLAEALAPLSHNLNFIPRLFTVASCSQRSKKEMLLEGKYFFKCSKSSRPRITKWLFCLLERLWKLKHMYRINNTYIFHQNCSSVSTARVKKSISWGCKNNSKGPIAQSIHIQTGHWFKKRVEGKVGSTAGKALLGELAWNGVTVS